MNIIFDRKNAGDYDLEFDKIILEKLFLLFIFCVYMPIYYL